MAEKNRTNAVNPLAGDTAADTVNICRCALAWLANVNDAPATGNEDWRFGHAMLLETIVEGLKHAERQLAAKPHLEVVNG